MPVTLVDGAGFQALHPALDARSRLSGYRVLASLDRLHVHSQFTPQSDAEISGAACDLRRIGACDQGFGRDAASVDAGAAERFSLDHGDLHAGVNQTGGKWRSCLSGSDDDCVVFLHVSDLHASAGRFFTSRPSQHHGYFHIRRAVSHTLLSLRLSSSMERSFPTIEEAKPH